MGMIREFYRIKDDKIIELKNKSHEFYVPFLEDNYASINGEMHQQNDTVFSLDKAWAITEYLIIENANTESEVLKNIFGKSLTENDYHNYSYILSKDVFLINEELQNIETKDLLKSYDEEKMIEKGIYKAKGFTNGFIIEHFLIIKLAFQVAVNHNCGLVISMG